MGLRIRRVAAGTSFLGVVLALGASLPSADVAQAAAGRPVARSPRSSTWW